VIKAVKIQRVSKASKPTHQMKAQIFLSCGQNEKELAIARKIQNKIHAMSRYQFDCYVAALVQDLDGLITNIFRKIEEADYFIFVDFRREELRGRKIHRGSLFANQELAIASFLRFRSKKEAVLLQNEVLLLQEKGMMPLDGMLSSIQGNVRLETFPSRRTLPTLIAKIVREKCEQKKWTDKTRNTLALSIYPKTIPEPPKKEDGSIAQPFHVMVKNLHYGKAACNCYAYLEEVEKLDEKGKVIENVTDKRNWEIPELKWAGTLMPFTRIAPTPADASQPRYRIFDAFWFTQKAGEAIDMKFFHAASSTDWFPHKLEFGCYRLVYLVVSDNFAPVQASFDFEFKSNQTINEALENWKGASLQLETSQH
jgi:hypothetical protein